MKTNIITVPKTVHDIVNKVVEQLHSACGAVYQIKYRLFEQRNEITVEIYCDSELVAINGLKNNVFIPACNANKIKADINVPKNIKGREINHVPIQERFVEIGFYNLSSEQQEVENLDSAKQE